MDNKNFFNITVAGKSYTLSGQESNDYLKNIAGYIEEKYANYFSNISFRTQPTDMQHIMLQVNIADDYFKCREQLTIQMRKVKEQAEEIERLKKSLVSMQVRYENLESGTKLTQKKYQELKEKISHLESMQKNDIF